MKENPHTSLLLFDTRPTPKDFGKEVRKNGEYKGGHIKLIFAEYDFTFFFLTGTRWQRDCCYIICYDDEYIFFVNAICIKLFPVKSSSATSFK